MRDSPGIIVLLHEFIRVTEQEGHGLASGTGILRQELAAGSFHDAVLVAPDDRFAGVGIIQFHIRERALFDLYGRSAGIPPDHDRYLSTGDLIRRSEGAILITIDNACAYSPADLLRELRILLHICKLIGDLRYFRFTANLYRNAVNSPLLTGSSGRNDTDTFVMPFPTAQYTGSK